MDHFHLIGLPFNNYNISMNILFCAICLILGFFIGYISKRFKKNYIYLETISEIKAGDELTATYTLYKPKSNESDS